MPRVNVTHTDTVATHVISKRKKTRCAITLSTQYDWTHPRIDCASIQNAALTGDALALKVPMWTRRESQIDLKQHCTSKKHAALGDTKKTQMSWCQQWLKSRCEHKCAKTIDKYFTRLFSNDRKRKHKRVRTKPGPVAWKNQTIRLAIVSTCRWKPHWPSQNELCKAHNFLVRHKRTVE